MSERTKREPFWIPCCYGSIYDRKGCTCDKSERRRELRLRKSLLPQWSAPERTVTAWKPVCRISAPCGCEISGVAPPDVATIHAKMCGDVNHRFADFDKALNKLRVFARDAQRKGEP